MSRFVRSNGPGSGRLPGIQPQRLEGNQVAVGETFHLKGNADIERDIHSSLEIIAQERLLEVETEAKALIIRAKAEAQKILEQANAQAKALLDQAQSEVDNIRETAHEEGFKTGYAEGYTDATTQVAEETRDLLSGAQILVEGAFLAEKRVMKHFESRALELIRHIVRQIINREMSDAPATVMAMVERATASLYLSGKVQVVVSAQVIHDLRQFAADAARNPGQALDTMSRFEFIADPALARDQIYIIGQDSCFDLSPETQLEHLLSAIEPQFSLPRDLDELPGNGATAAPPAPDDPAGAMDAANAAQNSNLAEVSAAPEDTGLSEPPADEFPAADFVPDAPLEASTAAVPDEADPVAWEEFPAELQQLEGFPAAAEQLAEQSAGAEPEMPELPELADLPEPAARHDLPPDESAPAESTRDSALTDDLDLNDPDLGEPTP